MRILLISFLCFFEAITSLAYASSSNSKYDSDRSNDCPESAGFFTLVPIHPRGKYRGSVDYELASGRITWLSSIGKGIASVANVSEVRYFYNTRTGVGNVDLILTTGGTMRVEGVTQECFSNFLLVLKRKK